MQHCSKCGIIQSKAFRILCSADGKINKDQAESFMGYRKLSQAFPRLYKGRPGTYRMRVSGIRPIKVWDFCRFGRHWAKTTSIVWMIYSLDDFIFSFGLWKDSEEGADMPQGNNPYERHGAYQQKSEEKKNAVITASLPEEKPRTAVALQYEPGGIRSAYYGKRARRAGGEDDRIREGA